MAPPIFPAHPKLRGDIGSPECLRSPRRERNRGARYSCCRAPGQAEGSLLQRAYFAEDAVLLAPGGIVAQRHGAVLEPEDFGFLPAAVNAGLLRSVRAA